VLSILVVDDDVDQREALADVLGDRNRIVLADDVPSALAAVAGDQAGFDLVLTDLRMPGRSGLDLQRDLRRLGLGLPVVLMSSDDHVSQLAVDEGFYDCLSKPLSWDLLDAILARVAAEKARPVSADALLAVHTPEAQPATASDDSDPEG
jgi:DNA-binding NtrC family response regulator